MAVINQRRLLSFLMVLLCCSVKAQIKWNAHIGLLSTHQHFKQTIPDNPIELKKIGFLMGANMGVRLYKSVWAETGLSWSGRVFGIQAIPAVNSHSNFTYRVNYLTLNQVFLLQVKTKNKVSFYGGAGFGGGMAVVGKKEVTISNPTSYTIENERLKIGNRPDDEIKRIETAFSFVLRAQFNKLLLNLISSYGLTEHPTIIGGTRHVQKNRTFYFGFGYEF